MQRLSGYAIGGVFLAILMALPALGANPAQPGTINYVEGQVFLGARPLDRHVVGSAYLPPGQSLSTGSTGRAELLLTPGVFLRVADNSAITMIAPGLADTVVRLDRGRAMVEVAELFKDTHLRVDQDGLSTRLMKPGLYDFDRGRDQIRVFDGQAVVRRNGHGIKVNGGREYSFNGPSKKAVRFDKNPYEDAFYRWGSVRSGYLSEANVDAAQNYMGGGDWWVGTGWYWDPWFSSYTFIPSDGIFYSPFGWSFYSPWLAYDLPFGYYAAGPRRHHDFDDHGRYGGAPHVARGFEGTSPHYYGFHHGPRLGGNPMTNRGFAGGFRGSGFGGHVGGGGRRH